MSETCLGLLLTDGDFTKWRQAMRTHGTQSVACYVSFETRAFEIYATLPLVKDLSTDDTVQFVSLTHIVANRGAGEQYYRMIS